MKRTYAFSIGMALLGSIVGAHLSKAWARPISVTITNLTRAQTFTPPILVSHKAGFRFFH